MRSVLVTALLANCGLFVPCLAGADVPQYDAYFLRTSSFDIPSEGKSSFAVEMSDLKAMMRDTSPHSFLMMDEIGSLERSSSLIQLTPISSGRGTSTVDGAALSGAILEWMSDKKCHGIFATHILELLRLPLRVPLHKMKMGMKLNAGRLSSTARLLITARSPPPVDLQN
jgi:DNA mismatch repair ATPase MutS